MLSSLVKGGAGASFVGRSLAIGGLGGTLAVRDDGRTVAVPGALISAGSDTASTARQRRQRGGGGTGGGGTGRGSTGGRGTGRGGDIRCATQTVCPRMQVFKDMQHSNENPVAPANCPIGMQDVKAWIVNGDLPPIPNSKYVPGKPMCPTWNVLGFCDHLTCKRAYDHKSYDNNDTQSVRFETWCQTCYTSRRPSFVPSCPSRSNRRPVRV